MTLVSRRTRDVGMEREDGQSGGYRGYQNEREVRETVPL